MTCNKFRNFIGNSLRCSIYPKDLNYTIDPNCCANERNEKSNVRENRRDRKMNQLQLSSSQESSLLYLTR